jgi:hypothetical protein
MKPKKRMAALHAAILFLGLQQLSKETTFCGGAKQHYKKSVLGFTARIFG